MLKFYFSEIIIFNLICQLLHEVNFCHFAYISLKSLDIVCKTNSSLFVMQVHVALDIVDEMCEAGLTLSTEVLHSVLQICEETFEYDLV